MFLCVLLSYPGQSSSLDHVNSGYIRDVRFTVIYKLKQARLQATLSSHRRVQRSKPTPVNKCNIFSIYFKGIFMYAIYLNRVLAVSS